MPYLVGLDFGTGGAKACVTDEYGAVLRYAYREYPIIHRRPGWSEHDATAYWGVAQQLIGEAVAGIDVRGVAGIAVSSALPSLVVVDSQGRPLRPAFNLMDRRATAEVSMVRELLGDDVIAATTANRVEDHPSIVNLLWLREHEPRIYETTHKALTIDGFIVSRLTGAYTVNTSAAAFYGIAFDILGGCFRNDLLDQIGIDPSILPQVHDCVEVVGAVTPAAAEEIGLPAGVPVLAGQVDCNAGWIAGGAFADGDMQMNLGTCGVLGIVHSRPDFLQTAEALQMVNIPYTTEPARTFTAVAVTTTGGQALRYLRDTFGQVEVDTAAKLGLDPYDLITLQAAEAPVGSDGLIVLPYLMGERSPIWDASARAMIFGLSLHHTRGHIFRAFMEGVAYAMYDSFRILQDSGLKMNWPLIFNEGGARSLLWRQIITDVLGIPTALLRDRTGAPRGDALLAGVGTGVIDSFEIAKSWTQVDSFLEPNGANHSLYLEHFEFFKQLYARNKDSYRDLHRLTGLTQ